MKIILNSHFRRVNNAYNKKFKNILANILIFILGYPILSNSCLAESLTSKCYFNYSKQETLSYCTKLIKIEPNNSKAFLIRGRTKFWAKDFQGAISDFNQTLSLSPNNALAYSFRGQAKALLENHIGAISDFTKEIALDPNNIYAYTNRGESKLALMDYHGALNDFNHTIELAPDSWRAYQKRGESKALLHDFRGAISDFTQAIILINSILENDDASLGLNTSTEEKINWKKLEQELDEIIKKELAEIYYLRGLSKLIIKAKNDACLDLSKAGELGFNKAYDTIQSSCN